MPADPNPVEVAEFKSTVTPMRCRRCKHGFTHIHVITIDGIDSLMISGAKVFRLELVCVQCGKVNYWNQREDEMAKQTEKFIEMLAVIHGEKVETKE